MTDVQQAVPVAQEDREAAADWFFMPDEPASAQFCAMVRDGRDDGNSLVQLLARHRLASLPCKSDEGAETWQGPAYEYGVTWGPDDAHPDATQTREAECFLCAGKCRGHGLADGAAWEPEAGSIAAEIRKALPAEPTEAMVLAAWDAAVPFGALPTTKCVPDVWRAMLAALSAGSAGQ